ncbi:MAG TPA: DNA-formamidopyrimidine glycosylase family protein [Solirubrobacterales bacterium]|nr:DNA-formamidopyrimidine glycosylase family protein [Solirubrobacterales bacterium]
MPELPEVETIRRQLEPDLNGRVIETVEVLDPYFTKPDLPGNFERAVNGREIVDVGRRGKYLLLELDDGLTVVIHLRMTGSLVLLAPDGSENPGDARIYEADRSERHLKARFTLDDGGELRFSDPRRFGRGFGGSADTMGSADSTGAVSVTAGDDAEAPHSPLLVPFEPRLAAWDPARRPGDLTAEAARLPFQALLRFVRSRREA